MELKFINSVGSPVPERRSEMAKTTSARYAAACSPPT